MSKYNDGELENLWDSLSDVPFDEDADGDLILAEDWEMFFKGETREEILHWFDEQHSKGVAWLLYEYHEGRSKENGDYALKEVST